MEDTLEADESQHVVASSVADLPPPPRQQRVIVVAVRHGERLDEADRRAWQRCVLAQKHPIAFSRLSHCCALDARNALVHYSQLRSGC